VIMYLQVIVLDQL
jgi:hypothetical protein